MNFAMMINLREAKPQSGSLLNSSSRVSNSNEKSEFENMMTKKEPLFDKNTNKNNSKLDKTSSKKIEINTKDKEALIEDLEEKLNGDYTKEDLVNIVNLYLAVNLITNDKSLKVNYVEFINVTEELISQENSLKTDILGVLELNNGVLSVPLISNILEDTAKSNKDLAYLEILKEIESMVQSSQKENYLKLGVDEILNNRKLDVFNKKNNDLIKIDEIFGIENIEFSDINSLDNQIQEEINKFSNFLMNQRVSNSNMKVKVLNINDEDMGVLMEMIDSKSNVDVTNLISPDIYGFKSNINDTIKTNIVPESIRESFIETDIAQTIQYMRNASINELTLKVKPKELGEVMINLVKSNDITDVVITIEREELFNSIKKNLMVINKELKDLGLKINDISIEMKQNNTANSTFNFMSNSNGDNSKNQNYNCNQDKKMKKSIGMIDDENISDTKILKNEVENEINLLA